MIQHQNYSKPKTRRLFIAPLLASICIFSVNSCIGPLVHIEKVDPVVVATVKVYKDASILKKSGVTILGPLQATSCQNLIFDPPASMTNCVDQLRMKVARLGGNAVLVGDSTRKFANFMPGSGGGGTGINRNCWTTVDCSAIALSIK
jgi:hypothetical protein